VHPHPAVSRILPSGAPRRRWMGGRVPQLELVAVLRPRSTPAVWRGRPEELPPGPETDQHVERQLGAGEGHRLVTAVVQPDRTSAPGWSRRPGGASPCHRRPRAGGRGAADRPGTRAAAPGSRPARPARRPARRRRWASGGERAQPDSGAPGWPGPAIPPPPPAARTRYPSDDPDSDTRPGGTAPGWALLWCLASSQHPTPAPTPPSGSGLGRALSKLKSE